MCDGNGFCVNGETNPCAVHGCDGKKCGDRCLRDGDIMGFCNKFLDCDDIKKSCGISILTIFLYLMNVNLKSDSRKCYFDSSWFWK